MQSSTRRLFLALGVAMFLTLTFVSFASDAPPPDDTASKDAAAQKAPDADQKTDAVPLVKVDEDTPPLHAIPASPKIAASDDDDDEHPAVMIKSKVHSHRNGGNDRVTTMSSNVVQPGEVVTGDCVAVMGDMSMEGEAKHDCVAVMGTNYINGPVGGSAVAVMGDLQLGPKAEIEGDAVCVGGRMFKEKGAIVHGNTINQLAGMPHFGAGSSAWFHGLSRGQFIPLNPAAHFLVVIAIAMFVLSLILVLAFPRGIAACRDALTHRFGTTLLTGFLALLALPFVFILLLVTVVGIPIALFVLPVAVVSAKVFGSAAILVLVGQSIFGNRLHPGIAFTIMALVTIALLATPVIGVPIFLILAFLGFASALSAIFHLRRPSPKVPPVVPPAPGAAVPPVVPGVPAGVFSAPIDVTATPLATAAEPFVDAGAGAVPPSFVPPVAAAVPPVIPLLASSLPRAGFWIRMVAMLVDIILVAIVVSPLAKMGHDYIVFWAGVYGAILWKIKGATLGDIIFHLKVVRLDGRPIDWPTAVVRALGCFVSLVCAFLGFIWIAFDTEKQAWHDKIAGTIVVQGAKPTSLV